MDYIATPTRTKQIINKYGFYFKKSFGQNFLIDKNIIDKIIDTANITKDDVVIEVGPGIGSLTQILCEKAYKVFAVEIDKNLIPILNDVLSECDNLSIINQDILKVDIKSLIEQNCENKNVKIVANLPYYITTPIVMRLLEEHLPIDSIVIMIQKEVADRMQADCDTKDYGALSVAVQYYTDAKIITNVPKNCFMPVPNVESAVIKLDVLEKPSVHASDEKLFFKLVKVAFSQRRKTLVNAVYNQTEWFNSKDQIKDVLENLGFDENVRGEVFSLQDFANLSNTIDSL